MNKNIIIPDEEDLNKKTSFISKDRKNKIFVIADFGRTFTRCFHNGKKISTSFAQIREKDYLGQNYKEKAFELYYKYYPIEKDPNLSIEEKIDPLTEWWKKHLELMIEYGLSKDIIINEIIKKGLIPLRHGLYKFIKILEKNNIPLIIVSQGVGDIYLELLNNKKILNKNIYFITNLFNFNKEGIATSVTETIIHPYNKHKIDLLKYSFYKYIKDRPNVLLMGDSLEDVGMIKNFKYKNLIKIGFLNEDVQKNIDDFKKNFDIILLNDSDMRYINKLLRALIKD